MKPGDLVKKFGVSDQTIRRWSTEFSDYLSPNQGRHRTYTADDYIVMATIYYLYSQEGLKTDGIHKQLSKGFRVDVEDIADIGYGDGRMVPAAVVEQVIDSSEMRAELELLRSERDRLIESLGREQEKNSRLESKLEEATAKIEALYERLLEAKD